MSANGDSAQLDLLEREIDRAIVGFSSAYPFLQLDLARAKKQQEAEEHRSEELTLSTMREIRESLAS